MPDNDEGMTTVEDAARAEEPTELECLREELTSETELTELYMREHDLGVHPMAIPQTQIRVLVEMMCPDEEDKVAFDIATQRMIRANMEEAVAEMERQRISQQLTTAMSTADVAAINQGKLPGGAVDLEALRNAPRSVRRQAARDLLRKDKG